MYLKKDFLDLFEVFTIKIQFNYKRPTFLNELKRKSINVLNALMFHPHNHKMYRYQEHQHIQTVKFTGYILYKILKWTFLVLLGRKYLWVNNYDFLQSTVYCQYRLPNGIYLQGQFELFFFKNLLDVFIIKLLIKILKPSNNKEDSSVLHHSIVTLNKLNWTCGNGSEHSFRFFRYQEVIDITRIIKHRKDTVTVMPGSPSTLTQPSQSTEY